MSFDLASIPTIADTVRNKNPLVHCITNYVTVNDCANALLAIGASPVMADDLSEAEEIAEISDALVINIGTLNERTIRSMIAAGKRASALGRPVLLDPVGAGASRLRTETAAALMAAIDFTVIRGNASEIMTLAAGTGRCRGVDAIEGDTDASAFESLAESARGLAARTGAVVAVTGAVDLVTDGKRTLLVSNGHPLMARITGSGCMLSAITGGFCGAAPDRPLAAVAAAIAAMGFAGEQAAAVCSEEGTGTGSFRMHLIDRLSLLGGKALSGGMKIEAR